MVSVPSPLPQYSRSPRPILPSISARPIKARQVDHTNQFVFRQGMDGKEISIREDFLKGGLYLFWRKHLDWLSIGQTGKFTILQPL